MPFELFLLPATDLLPYCMLGLLAMAEGPIATLLGGAATSRGLLLPLPVFLSVVLGNLTADLGWYMLGRCGKLEWLLRLGPKLGVNPQRILQLEQGIQKHAPRLLFFAKLTVGFPIPTLVATGIGRVPVRRWAGLLVLGELIKSAVLISLGYVYSQALQQTSSDIQTVLWCITALLCAGGLIGFKCRKIR